MVAVCWSQTVPSSARVSNVSSQTITPSTSVKVVVMRTIQPWSFSQKRLSGTIIPAMEITNVAKTKMEFTIAACFVDPPSVCSGWWILS